MKQTLKQARNRITAVAPVQTAMGRLGGALPQAIQRHVPPVGPHRVTTPDGLTFTYVADHGDMMGGAVVWRQIRDWEETTIPTFTELARSSRGFVDVGAYAGIYSLIACTANPALQAVAFEPNPASYERLSRNVKANGLEQRIIMRSEAVSDEPGRAVLTIPHDVTAAQLNAIDGDHIDVEVVRVEDVLPRGFDVDLVKIDVEGLEPNVLRGMSRVLEEQGPSVIVECLDDATFAPVADVLGKHGYRHYTYFGPDGPVPMDANVNKVPRYANILCRREPL